MLPINPRDFLSDLIDIKKINYNKEFNKVAKIHKYWSRKPWYLIEDHILKYSKAEDVVVDPFMGSGTVGLEAIFNNRKFVGYDLNPVAVFVADLTLHELNFDVEKYSEELFKIKEDLYEQVINLYKVEEGRFILYHTSEQVKNLDYNCVTVDFHLKKQQKIILGQEILNAEYKVDLPFPDSKFPVKFYKDRFSYKGYSLVSDFFNLRNLKALTIIYNYISKSSFKNKSYFLLAFSNTLLHVSKLKGLNVRPLGVNNYWIPDDNIQENVMWRFMDRAKNLLEAKTALNKRAKEKKILDKDCHFQLHNKSSIELEEIDAESVDYLITDPPYGDTIQYSELSFIWNCWLEKEFKISDEVIINPVQNKGTAEFHNSINKFILHAKRVLKNNGYFTLCFQNKDLNIWYKIINNIYLHDFELIDVKIYDTLGNPYNKNWAKFSPKSDLYVTFRKSNVRTQQNDKTSVNIIDLIREIKSVLKANTIPLDMNKAYDLLVASLIHYLFNNYLITGIENLTLKKIIALFGKNTEGGVIQGTNFSNIQTKLPLS